MLKLDPGIEERINMAQPAGMKAPKKPSESSIIESIYKTTQEMVTIATLKEALANYLLLDDIYEYENNTDGLAYLLGRLELSLIRRKQSIAEDRKALSEPKDE